MSEWRPIETAPCDDTLALVLYGDDGKAAPYPFNVYPEDLDRDSDPQWWKERGATHWMPAPEPPEE